MKYYIYSHAKPDGEVFYVGKGSGKRLHQTGNRSVFWKRLVKKYGFVSTVLFADLTEAEAFSKEIETIAAYKAIGQCVANFTDGGDGVRVEKRWWGKAISESLKGVKRQRGKLSKSYKDVITKEMLVKLYVNDGLSSPEIAKLTGLSIPSVIARARQYGITPRTPGKLPKAIECLNDGRKFQSISEAAAYYGLFRENIRKVLAGKYRHTGNRTFAYSSELNSLASPVKIRRKSEVK